MITFKQLWENHPTITDDDNPCTSNGKVNFTNQCAIRLGTCFQRCGIDTTRIPSVRHCWQHKKTEGHILAAEELANGLMKYPIGGINRVQKVTPADFHKTLDGKKGIILFKDYYARSNGALSGDHIDLWNGSRITDWSSWLRIQMGIVIPGVWSDLEESKSIMFWRVH